MIDHSPGFWMNETGDVLQPAVWAFFADEPLSEEQIAALRAYIRQWIAASGFFGPEVEALRGRVDGLTSVEALKAWWHDAVDAGVDPF